MGNGAVFLPEDMKDIPRELLLEEIMRLRSQLEKERQHSAVLKAKLDNSNCLIQSLLKAPYEARSERFARDARGALYEQLQFEGAEADEEAEKAEENEPSSSDRSDTPPRQRRRRKRRSAEEEKKRTLSDWVNHMDVDPENVIIEEGEVPECGICGHDMKLLSYSVRREVCIRPAEVYVREHRTPVYSCGWCDKHGTTVPVMHAQSELARPIPRSLAAPETLAYILYLKAGLGMPLFRIENLFAQLDIPISRMTLSNWMNTAGMMWLAPVAGCLREKLLRQPILHMDETPFHVVWEEGRTPQAQGYVWIYASTCFDVPVRYIVLEYQPSRSAKCPQNFLGNYTGTMVTDAYAAYGSLMQPDKPLFRSGCRAHAGRPWFKAWKSTKPKAGHPLSQGLAFIGKLFRLEEKFAEYTPAERFAARLRYSKPLLDKFRKWLEKQYRGDTPLGKAVNYVLNHWDVLYNVLSDGRLPLTNAAAEICAKGFAVGRKNFLFAQNPEGAGALMAACSVVETAKANNLNVYAYLTWILTDMPKRVQLMERLVLPAVSSRVGELSMETAEGLVPDDGMREMFYAEIVQKSARHYLPEYAPPECRRQSSRTSTTAGRRAVTSSE